MAAGHAGVAAAAHQNGGYSFSTCVVGDLVGMTCETVPRRLIFPAIASRGSDADTCCLLGTKPGRSVAEIFFLGSTRDRIPISGFSSDSSVALGCNPDYLCASPMRGWAYQLLDFFIRASPTAAPNRLRAILTTSLERRRQKSFSSRRSKLRGAINFLGLSKQQPSVL
jgi:hypothetical protein